MRECILLQLCIVALTTATVLGAGQYPLTCTKRSGGLVFCSGTLPADELRFGSTDIANQTRHVLDALKGRLSEVGSGLADVVFVDVYLRDASDLQEMDKVYRTYWPKNPPARTTTIADLVEPKALVEIATVAIQNRKARAVNPKGWANPPGPYSYAVKSGTTLFLAGLSSIRAADGSFVGGDISSQTRTVLENAKVILQAVGMNFTNVVSSRIALADALHFQGMNSIYRNYFPSDPPARATVSTPLPQAGSLIEVTMVAVEEKNRSIVTTPNADGTPGPKNPNLSSAIRVGNRLYVSGTLGDTEGAPTDIESQTRGAMEKIRRTLHGGGFDWPDVVESVVYLTDWNNYERMSTVYRGFFPTTFPVLTTVRTDLVAPGGLVEIMVTAVK